VGAKFIQEGYSVDYIPDVDVAQGGIVVANQLVGVAQREIKAGTLGALSISGIFDFPKTPGGGGDGLGFGALAYWDEGNEVVTWISGGANKPLGKVVKAATDADETVRVMLVQALG